MDPGLISPDSDYDEDFKEVPTTSATTSNSLSLLATSEKPTSKAALKPAKSGAKDGEASKKAPQKRPSAEASVSDSSPSPKKKKTEKDGSKDEKVIEEATVCHGKSKRDVHEDERLKMQVLVSNFTEEQLNRYEMYRRAAFPKAAIKRLMQSISGTSISQNVVIAMSGIAKVYAGELVETALDAREEWNEMAGPIQPKHVREAVRRLRLKNAIPVSRNLKQRHII